MGGAPGNLVGKPYGVLREFTDPDGRHYSGKYAGSVDSNIGGIEASYKIGLDDILLVAAANERGKEIGYINKLRSSLLNTSGGPVPYIYTEIDALFNQLITPGAGVSGATVSKIIDTLQKIKLGLYDVTKSIAENNEAMKAFNSITLSETLMTSINEVFNAIKQSDNSYIYNNITNVVNKSGKKIIQDILNAVEKNIQNKIQNNITNKNITLTDKQQQVIDKLIITYKTKLEHYYNGKFKSMKDAEILDKKLEKLDEEILKHNKNVKSKERINGKDKPIYQFIHEVIVGSMGGEALEITIDLTGGGVGTGRVLNKGKAIDADNILLATGELEFMQPNLSKLTPDKNGNLQYDDLLREIDNNQQLIDGFVLMFSDKDQSTNASFNDYVATNTNVKLKDPGSLASRRGEIEMMFSAVGGSAEELIFGLANIANDFVCDGQVEQAKMALGTVCVAWMFNDAVEIVQKKTIFKNTHATTLHFYNINGYYYTLSDILYKTAHNLSGGISKGMKYVTISLTKPSSNPYVTMLSQKGHPEGIGQWDFVSDNLMSKTKIGVQMNVKNLFNDLFSFK